METEEHRRGKLEQRFVPHGKLSSYGLMPNRYLSGFIIREGPATIEQYIATRPIMALCWNTAPLPGSSHALRWWQQDHTAPVVGAESTDEHEEENSNNEDDNNSDDENSE